MPRFLASALVLVSTTVPTVVAQNWGQPVNGLRISVTVAPETRTGRYILLKLQNVGDTDLLVPIGLVVAKAHPVLVELHVKGADGKNRRVLYTALAGIAGYLEPWNIRLRSGESYTVRTPISSYHVPDGKELSVFIRRPCQLWVELGSSGECTGPDPTKPFPCWRGRVVSNVLHFPQ
jgi:hypothetical protein